MDTGVNQSTIEPRVSEIDVKQLQADLFPPKLKETGSYFANLYFKPSAFCDDQEIEEDPREAFSRELLFSLNKEVVFNPQPPRWPTECQVLEEPIKHIEYIPSSPEPYYHVTGREVQMKPVGEECGVVVYQYIPISAFTRSSIGGSKYLMATCICPEEEGLRFESRFESGNLERAVRVTASYYELYLRPDLYTGRHMQWFYFRVTNMRKNFLYRFAIVNLTKEASLFNQGMKPVFYSTKDSQLHSVGWRRCGDNITYYSNDNGTSEENAKESSTYTLTFTLEFPHEDDVVYIAHSYPYTYSDLQDYLVELSKHPLKSAYTTLRLLCKSLAGNNVYYVTVTSPQIPGEIKKKRAVVLTARVHPGETPASWMMKGTLDFLTGDSSPAKELRDRFIFKLVPMLNPDGVIVGNNRCSLAAKDLNRQYRTVMRDAYPSIWYTKLMVRRLLEECGVAMYCDFHSHSRRHNIFIYGCESKRGSEKRLQEQVFPLMLHKNTADKFSFEQCQFRVQRAKEGTGRVVMWSMGVGDSYTLEASFAGSSLGQREDTHFSIQDFEAMGRSFCQTLLDYYDDDPRKERLRLKIINRLLLEGSNADEPTNIQLSDYSSDDGDTSGSASSNEAGKEEDVTWTLVVPPPSPALSSRKNNRLGRRSKPRVLSRSPNITRKLLHMCKATLSLSLSDKNANYSSDSEISEYETDNKQGVCDLAKPQTKKRRKKKLSKKKINARKDHSDSEILTKKPTRSYSVLDFMPLEKPKQTIKTKRSRTPQPKRCKRSSVSQQLSEVQTKLLVLKSKFWFGVNSGIEVPVFSTPSNMPLIQNVESLSKSTTLNNNKKLKKKSHKLPEKNEKKNKENKIETGQKEKDYRKTHTGVKRQNAVEWIHATTGIGLRKTRSLPETTLLLQKPKVKMAALSSDDQNHEKEKDAKKKKKKRKMKLVKKSASKD